MPNQPHRRARSKIRHNIDGGKPLHRTADKHKNDQHQHADHAVAAQKRQIILRQPIIILPHVEMLGNLPVADVQRQPSGHFIL